MAMYRCSRCDQFIDDDWHPCTEDPLEELGLMCPFCAEGETPRVRHGGVFTKEQLEIIKKLEAEAPDEY